MLKVNRVVLEKKQKILDNISNFDIEKIFMIVIRTRYWNYLSVLKSKGYVRVSLDH